MKGSDLISYIRLSAPSETEFQMAQAAVSAQHK
jgi:hypothetical protein